MPGADMSVVRAWDFSGAEEVQARLDATKLQRAQQRAHRRERGRHAGRCRPSSCTCLVPACRACHQSVAPSMLASLASCTAAPQVEHLRPPLLQCICTLCCGDPGASMNKYSFAHVCCRRLQPRFPPQWDTSEDEASAEHHSQSGEDLPDSPCMAPDGSHCAEVASSELRSSLRAASQHQGGEGIHIPGQDSHEAECASRNDSLHREADQQNSWSFESGGPSADVLSRSLPARLGTQRAGSGSSAGGRQIRPLPPPLVRASGCCIEAGAARISRMTSWDIQRPRRSSSESVKAAG